MGELCGVKFTYLKIHIVTPKKDLPWFVHGFPKTQAYQKRNTEAFWIVIHMM